jgi:NitT/TauT family transport system substrate-binding protein
MVPKDSPIKTLQDLQGKAVGTVSKNGNLWIAFQNALKKDGVDPSSVKGVQMPLPNMADQLTAHRVDAVLAIAPFSNTIKKDGNKVIGRPQLSIGANVIGQIFVANRNWAQSHKQELSRFISALKDATAYMKKHPEVSAKQLSQFTGQSLKIAKNTLLPPFSYDLNPKGIALWQHTMAYVHAGPTNVKSLNPDNLVLDLSS